MIYLPHLSHQQIQVLELVGVQDVHGVVHEARGEERGRREDLGVVGLGDVGDREALSCVCVCVCVCVCFGGW